MSGRHRDPRVNALHLLPSRPFHLGLLQKPSRCPCARRKVDRGGGGEQSPLSWHCCKDEKGRGELNAGKAETHGQTVPAPGARPSGTAAGEPRGWAGGRRAPPRLAAAPAPGPAPRPAGKPASYGQRETLIGSYAGIYGGIPQSSGRPEVFSCLWTATPAQSACARSIRSVFKRARLFGWHTFTGLRNG